MSTSRFPFRTVTAVVMALAVWFVAADMYRKDAQFECLLAGGDVAITSPFFKRACIAFTPTAHKPAGRNAT